MAAALRHKMLTVITESAESGELSSILDILDANALKLFKDSEDRAHGTPKATSEVTGEGGGALAMALTVKTQIVDGD